MPDLEISLSGVAAAIGLGLLIGVVRERANPDRTHTIAGARTHVLVALATTALLAALAGAAPECCPCCPRGQLTPGESWSRHARGACRQDSAPRALKLSHAPLLTGLMALLLVVSAWLQRQYRAAGVLAVTAAVALVEVHAAAASIAQLRRVPWRLLREAGPMVRG